MNPSQCKQFEIEIVDDILGNLPLKRAQALQYHLAECSSCQKLYGEWSELLKDGTRVHPSAQLYKRLRKHFIHRQASRKTLQTSASTIWGAASVALIGMLILALVTIQGRQPLDSWEKPPVGAKDIPSFVAEDIPHFVTDDTDTVQYLIDPQKGRLTSINGIIWVNSNRDELYCFVQNLEDNAHYDYQIWLIKPVKRENGGLLRIIDQYGELYLRQKNIQEIQQISISQEPKGGSLYPTTDDTILVDFNLQ
ncbi:MAG: zf-HC2 domain-containing protein [Firmicutes bacterium]|jgi:hypothetical protein|nr:zf-HC2 domain-containing protein [Bacillota bacterium]